MDLLQKTVTKFFWHVHVLWWLAAHGAYTKTIAYFFEYLSVKLVRKFEWEKRRICFFYGNRKWDIQYFGSLYVLLEMFDEKQYECDAPDSPVIFDVGANIGAYSLWAAVTYNNSIIYAYEPVGEVFGVLKRNIEKNAGPWKIYAFNKAISNRGGIDTVCIGSSPSAAKLGCESPETIRREKAEVTTLDSEVKRLGIKNIDILKIDTEGWEVPILYQVKGNLWKIVKNIVVEYHSTSDRKKILGLLKRFNFSTEVFPKDEECGIIRAAKRRIL